MKKIFESPELEVVRFVEADIVVCSGCSESYYCNSYGHYDLGSVGDPDCSTVCDWYEVTGNEAYFDPACIVDHDNGCSPYGAAGVQSSCAVYTEPWEDEYGNSGEGTYEYNEGFGDPEAYAYGYVGCTRAL